jgi:hypothetical protein
MQFHVGRSFYVDQLQKPDEFLMPVTRHTIPYDAAIISGFAATALAIFGIPSFGLPSDFAVRHSDLARVTAIVRSPAFFPQLLSPPTTAHARDEGFLPCSGNQERHRPERKR